MWAIPWAWDPSVVLGCLSLLIIYAAAVRFRFSRAAWSFVAGVLILLFALVSPLDTLGDVYLFTAHMFQHLLLILVVPPLLLAGIPPAVARRVLAYRRIARLERQLRRPVLAWLIGEVTLWVWHLPSWYGAALADERVHVVEHLTFLVSATIFWWPVATPLVKDRLSPLGTMFYLVPAGMLNTLLGVVLAFSRLGAYPAYYFGSDPFGLWPLLRGAWGLSPALDQQLAGLLMWAPGSFVYLGVVAATLLRWLGSPDWTGVAANAGKTGQPGS